MFQGPGAPDAAEFEVCAPDVAWREFFTPVPSPPYHHYFAMLMRVDGAAVRGSELRFAQSCHLVRQVLELGRQACSGRPVARVPTMAPCAPGGEEPRGTYRTVTVADVANHVYYEQSGNGPDVVLLHTAGADARQYHHLLRDSRVSSQYRMSAPDLPWHGRSFPPPGSTPGGYVLSTDLYVQTAMALVDALELEQPVVVGCSMAGLVCLELAYRHPDRFAGMVACEASERVPGRQVPWALHPEVNQAVFVPEWIDGLMGPETAPEHRQEIWWNYSQSGFGTFFGDICFYSHDFYARDRVSSINTDRCPVVMMTGEYDYSCIPEMSRRMAERIPGARFELLRGLGHFPHAENPRRFADHLLDALATMTTGRGS
jgi:pimeloyl-ACP methyl ester carboxylesterase